MSLKRQLQYEEKIAGKLFVIWHILFIDIVHKRVISIACLLKLSILVGKWSTAIYPFYHDNNY